MVMSDSLNTRIWASGSLLEVSLSYGMLRPFQRLSFCVFIEITTDPFIFNSAMRQYLTDRSEALKNPCDPWIKLTCHKRDLLMLLDSD